MRASLLRLGRFLIAGIGLLASASYAQTAEDFGVEPWSETVVSVAEFEPTTKLFREAGDWRLTLSGAVNKQELAYWALPDTAGGRFERWCAPQADTGCIRFVRFSGVEQRPIRPAARPWDTGGIFSIMVRSDDVDRAV